MEGTFANTSLQMKKHDDEACLWIESPDDKKSWNWHHVSMHILGPYALQSKRVEHERSCATVLLILESFCM